MKVCTKCKVEQDLSEFYKQYEGKSSWCRTCILKRRKETFDPAKQKIYYNKRYKGNKNLIKENNLQANYGMSVEDWNTLFEKQKGLCGLCGSPMENNIGNFNKGKMPVVDHDHDTNKVRALLHGNCNRAIGLMGENSSIMFAAYKYLLEHGR